MASLYIQKLILYLLQKDAKDF